MGCTKADEAKYYFLLLEGRGGRGREKKKKKKKKKNQLTALTRSSDRREKGVVASLSADFPRSRRTVRTFPRWPPIIPPTLPAGISTSCFAVTLCLHFDYPTRGALYERGKPTEPTVWKEQEQMPSTRGSACSRDDVLLGPALPWQTPRSGRHSPDMSIFSSGERQKQGTGSLGGGDGRFGYSAECFKWAAIEKRTFDWISRGRRALQADLHVGNVN